MGIVNLAYQAFDKRIMDSVDNTVKKLNKGYGKGKAELSNILSIMGSATLTAGLIAEEWYKTAVVCGVLFSIGNYRNYNRDKLFEDPNFLNQLDSYSLKERSRFEQMLENEKSLYKTYGPIIALVGTGLTFSGLNNREAFLTSLGISFFIGGVNSYVRRTESIRNDENSTENLEDKINNQDKE